MDTVDNDTTHIFHLSERLQMDNGRVTGFIPILLTAKYQDKKRVAGYSATGQRLYDQTA